MASRAAAQAKENVQNGFGALKRGTILLRSPEGRAKMLKKVVDGFAHVTSPLQARTRASTAADVREKETKRRRIHYGLTGKTGVKLRDLTLTDSDVNDLVKSLKRSGSRTWWSRTRKNAWSDHDAVTRSFTPLLPHTTPHGQQPL